LLQYARSLQLKHDFYYHMRDIIKEKLDGIESDHGVKVLFACESGSRAWGFASPDSDYDVRFVYAQPRDHYLRIRERKDVIELPVNAVLDIGGWDCRKALQLFLKSNAPLYEWLQSPIVYNEKSGFAAELRGLMATYFSLKAGGHHYLSMARNAFENDLQGGEVKLKKYFYALRPALACMWIVEKGSVPPMEFAVLRTLVEDPSWNAMVDELLERKKVADEKALIAAIPKLQEWIAKTLEFCKERTDLLPPVKHDTEELDELFRKYITQ
jgi:predicted nucleotidyltransferase